MDEAQERDFLIGEARRDLLFYTTVCDPTYIVSKVHARVANRLEAVVEGACKRLILSVPPRVGKTRLSCIEMPTYALGRYPDRQFLVAGHGLSLPLESSRACRARMNDPVYQAIFDTRITPGDARIEEWGTVGGGKYKALGMGAGVLGRGADIVICDDIVRGFEMAHSVNQLEKAWNWFWTDVRTRLSPNGAIVIIMSRLSTQDIVGRMLDPNRIAKLKADADVLADEQWEVIHLPALARANDPLGRKEGESIFPERWPTEYYRSLKATTLGYVWSAMYDQDPVMAGGNYIPVAQIQIVDPEAVPQDLRWCRGWDLATSSKQTSDETAGVAGAFGPDGTLYLKDMIHGRWDWPDARGTIANIARNERIPVGIEAVAGFKTSFANLQEVLPPNIICTQYGVDKDKLTRALGWIALVPKKKLALVRGSWVTEFLIQAERFSGKADDTDDMIDSVSLVYQMLVGGLQGPIPVNIDDRLARALTDRRRRALDG